MILLCRVNTLFFNTLLVNNLNHRKNNPSSSHLPTPPPLFTRWADGCPADTRNVSESTNRILIKYTVGVDKRVCVCVCVCSTLIYNNIVPISGGQ